VFLKNLNLKMIKFRFHFGEYTLPPTFTKVMIDSNQYFFISDRLSNIELTLQPYSPPQSGRALLFKATEAVKDPSPAV
jgi:hypothetical protein